MLQEVDQVDEEAVELDFPTIERTKQRSLDVVFDSIEMAGWYVAQLKSLLYAVFICPTRCEASRNTFLDTEPFIIPALFADVQYTRGHSCLFEQIGNCFTFLFLIVFCYN